MSQLALSNSFEYLCYGFPAITNTYTLQMYVDSYSAGINFSQPCMKLNVRPRTVRDNIYYR